MFFDDGDDAFFGGGTGEGASDGLDALGRASAVDLHLNGEVSTMSAFGRFCLASGESSLDLFLRRRFFDGLPAGYGGGAGGGVKVTPLCFLIVQDGSVRMMPVPVPASSTADRIVEMMPDTLEKLNALLGGKKAEKTGE